MGSRRWKRPSNSGTAVASQPTAARGNILISTGSNSCSTNVYIFSSEKHYWYCSTMMDLASSSTAKILWCFLSFYDDFKQALLNWHFLHYWHISSISATSAAFLSLETILLDLIGSGFLSIRLSAHNTFVTFWFCSCRGPVSWSSPFDTATFLEIWTYFMKIFRLRNGGLKLSCISASTVIVQYIEHGGNNNVSCTEAWR